jgi:hypothetical protein
VPAALKRQWVWESGPDVPVDSSPAIVGGVVYVGTAAGELVALGLDDGKLRWRYKAGESIGESSPAVAAGRVFIGDLDGSLHAVNTTDGKRLWSYKTQSEIKCSPLVVGEVVLIGSYDASLYALGAADGKLRWTVKTDNYVHGTPAVVDGIAYFAGCDEIFHAVRVSDGHKVFSTSATAYTGASVAIVDAIASSRFIRRRRSWTAWSSSADAIEWCMRSTPRPARRVGPTCLARASMRLRRLLPGAYSSDRTMAASTCSTSPAAKYSGSTKMAVR